MAGIASAQVYKLDWQAIRPGGGASSGGGFDLRGTVQSRTGAIKGGVFDLESGLAVELAVASTNPESPVLHITLAGDEATIIWTADQAFTLEQSGQVAGGTWTAVSSSSPVKVVAGGQDRFYRLRKN